MGEPILNLEDLFAEAAFDPDLVYNVVKVPVLLLWLEKALTLTALRASLSQPLGYAASVEDLFTGAALDRTCWNAKTNRTDEWVNESPILFLDVFFAKPIGFLQHELY